MRQPWGKLEEEWQALYSFRSSHCSLNANDGIDYHYLAYEAKDSRPAAEGGSDPGLSHWWRDFLALKADFGRQYVRWQQEHKAKPDWNECLSCFLNGDEFSKSHGRYAGQRKPADGQAPLSHLVFADFLWNHRQAARHGDLFRKAIAQIDPSLTLFARKYILKPEFWRDDSSDVKDPGTKLHYRSSSFTSWAYPSLQNEADKVPPRDVIIQICIQWKRGIEVTNHILRCAGYAALYRRDPVDRICADTLMHTHAADDPVELLYDTKQTINRFWQKYKVCQGMKEKPIGGTDSDKCSELWQSVWEASREEKLTDDMGAAGLTKMAQTAFGDQLEKVCLAGDYGLRQVLRAYLDQPENYIRNLFYTKYDAKEHTTSPIFSGRYAAMGNTGQDFFRNGDAFQSDAPEEQYMLANPELRLMVRSLRRQQAGRSAEQLSDRFAAQRDGRFAVQKEQKESSATQLAAINTIMSLNDLLCPQEMFDLVMVDADGHDLHPHKNYVNEKRTSTNSSTACRLLDPDRGLSVRKIELIRYMLAAGQEDELGENLVEGGFWPVNYLHQEEMDEDEMDLTDYILVYAFRCRSFLLGERTLSNSTRYQEFSMIRLLMGISRELQLMACVHDGAGKMFFQTVQEYCPYYVSLPRYVSGNTRAVNPIEKTDRCRKNPVPADVYCCGWIADYELAYDRRRGV